MLSLIPDVVTGGLAVAGGFIVVVGYAMVLNMMSVKYLMPFFFLGFVVGGYLNFSLLSFGVVGLVIALIYVQLNPNYKQMKTFAQASPDNSTAAEYDDELED